MELSFGQDHAFRRWLHNFHSLSILAECFVCWKNLINSIEILLKAPFPSSVFSSDWMWLKHTEQQQTERACSCVSQFKSDLIECEQWREPGTSINKYRACIKLTHPTADSSEGVHVSLQITQVPLSLISTCINRQWSSLRQLEFIWLQCEEVNQYDVNQTQYAKLGRMLQLYLQRTGHSRSRWHSLYLNGWAGVHFPCSKTYILIIIK